MKKKRVKVKLIVKQLRHEVNKKKHIVLCYT